MAKKRRKPHGRPRTQGPSGSTVGTAERESGNGRRPAAATAGGRARPAPERGSEASAAGAAQRTRSEKKELARRQREEIRKRVQRAQRARTLALVLGGAVVVGAAVYWFARPDEPAVRPDTLPGELTTPAPWDANADLAAERADAIGLPTHGTNLAMHEHANVQVFVDGSPVAVPVDIGIDQADGDVASVHTHSGDGVVHVESSTVAAFTLGQFFDVWGVRFGDTCLGGYCEEGQDRIRVFANGVEAPGAVRDVPLDDLTTIVVAYGTEEELPDPIPSSFDFSTVTP